ncbi:SDR family oxidoreductase [Nigerium massiliense]|uniref:SDR family oxidoreductase n=1 Tax=Nigerium massiliense TaxID=1522317 RepID=UPI00058E9856|nr:SDR family oxidoreductase [Nigerium massiliense]
MTTLRPVALITGGSRGIGRAIAHELASTHDLLIGGSSPESVGGAVDDLRAAGASAEAFICDLADEDDTARAAGQVRRLDVLIHSAGIGTSGEVGETGRDPWRRIFELNVIAVADLTRLLLPLLRESGRGHVLTINSGSGYKSGPGGGLYSGSKFALRALTDALREEERGTVRVTSVHPGRVDTDMQVQLQAEKGRPYVAAEHLRPASVAAVVRMAVDATPEANVDEVSIRPVFVE